MVHLSRDEAAAKMGIRALVDFHREAGWYGEIHGFPIRLRSGQVFDLGALRSEWRLLKVMAPRKMLALKLRRRSKEVGERVK
jgi:hypothetical protein